MNESIVDTICRLFHEKGDASYIGEPVSQTQHALQAAWEAEKQGAEASLIVAALLHDVGHLLHHLPEDFSEQGIDDRHEELGYRFLIRHFGEAVAEPVRLHVPAKRYLCAVDQTYLEQLSPASQLSLKHQGGVFTEQEVEAFRQLPYAEAAVALRRWDDLAKIPDLQTPNLAHFRPYLEKVVVR